MKIVITSKDRNKDINIRIPMAIIISFIRFGKIPNKNIDENTLSIIDKSSEKINKKFIKENKKIIIKGLKYINKNYKGLVVVDVEEEHGDKVRIEI